MRVAFLTASCMFKSSPDARKDHWEHDLEFNAPSDPCAHPGWITGSMISNSMR